MLREKELFLYRLMKLTDAFLIFISFFLSYFLTLWVRSGLGLGPLLHIKEYYWLPLITIPVWIRLMSYDGVYLNFRTKLFIEILWRILRTGVGTFLILGSVVFILKMHLTSRFFVIVFAGVSTLLLFI